MGKFNPDKAIDAVNDRLKASGISPRIRRNGGKLIIRVTLPPRRGDGSKNKRYELSLGLPASADGMKVAESKAHDIARQLMLGTFSWEEWERSQAQEKTVTQLVDEFKADYLRSQPLQDSTWKHWERTFNLLPQNAPLTDAAILAVVLAGKANTNTRKRTCQRLQALADHAGVKIDLKPYQGNYGRQSVQARDIPSDDLILEWRDRIKNPSWQWVYGMVAAFGCRPHEAFHCRFVEPDVIDILKSKTYPHRAYAVLPEWAIQWNLIDMKLPGVEPGRALNVYGDRTKTQFQRYEIPFPAYSLRHAYAIRGSIVEGHSVGFMSASMGHDEATHMKTYHRWLSNKTSDQIYQEYKRSRGNV